jgi:solute carrier family 32 (vesicular inhibitory amino acid transporter)
MILTAFSKFTLTMFPLALGIEEIVAPILPSDRAMDLTASVIKLVLIVTSLAVAMFVPSFSFICALVGLICTMAVSVIFPAAAHLQLFGEKLSNTEIVLDWVLIFVGGFVAVVGTIATV